MLFHIFPTVLLAIASYASGDEYIPPIPSFLNICHRNDPRLNECVKQSVESLRPYLKNGIPELGLPPCEPVLIPAVDIDQAAGPISMRSVYKNLTIYGGTDFILKSVRIDTDMKWIRLKIGFPVLEMHSVYSIDGKILLLPITGSGMAHSNFSDVKAILTVESDYYQSKVTGQKHLRINDLYIDFTIGHCHIDLENLFNGDQTLANAMNLFLNDNWQTAAAELKPVCEKTAAKVFKNVANKIFAMYPLDVLLPP